MVDNNTEIIETESGDNQEKMEIDENNLIKSKKKMVAGKDLSENPIFSVQVLKLIKDVQLQHGLRHTDYQRYRCYCSRRLRRLRKTLNLPSSERHNFKKKIVIDEQHLNDKSITIPLILSERAWSYAMQLRLEANTEPRKKFHLINRLRKAAEHALQLQQLCDSPRFDNRTKLEVEGYVAWMHGTLHFELQLWNSAIEYFKKAQMIYEKLASALNEEDAQLYRQRSEEMTPSLRYCAYNLGEASATELLQLRSQAHGELLKNLDILVAQTMEYSTDIMHEIKWRNKSIPCKLEKVKTFLLADRDLEQSFVNESLLTNINILEQHLMDCKDAISAARDDCKMEKNCNDGFSSVQFLLHYLSYIRLNRTIQRNMLMIEIAKKEAEGNWSQKDLKAMDSNVIQRIKSLDITRMYEIIIQNLMEMEQLPISEYDSTFVTEIQTKIKAYQAFRCYSIGENLSSVGRWGDTVKIFERAIELANIALESKYLEDDISDKLKELVHKINSSRIIIRAKSILKPHAEKQSITKKVLLDRLDEYYEDPSLISGEPRIAEIPPPMIPIPCKPVFFDVALDMVKFPSLNDKIDGKKSNMNPSGIKGFVKGLWGWNNPK